MKTPTSAPSLETDGTPVERRAISVDGIVQGVGFRPLVHRLAERFGVCGFVQNRGGSVRIEAEGPADALEGFVRELAAAPPPLARIDRVSWERQPPRGETEFRIAPSSGGSPASAMSNPEQRSSIRIAPDAATCEDCLAELFDPSDRRYRYPFLNCTNCGPRLTIVTGAPYDRARTTMAEFVMCAACRAEYENPADRRFHAQPTACPACGPRLRLLDASGHVVETRDPAAAFAAALRDGAIGTLKGLGGYHLACDARDEAAVAMLRRRKHRDEKPFAVMVGGLAAAEALCEIAPTQRDLLLSPARPIVLLRRRSAAIAPAVAPGNPWLGVMLPYTPLHHLLLSDLEGAPLVMTSGNRSDEPIAYEDRDAVERLAGIADLFLVHDRPIHVRCEDSVTRVAGGYELPLRRSRGRAPEPVALPFECPRPILAVGAQLKGTFALGTGRHAVVSHHLGDLDDFEAFRAFEKDIALYEQLFEVLPESIACDLHPDYLSTRYAVSRVERERERDAERRPLFRTATQPRGAVPLVAVQHHHAHMASCMAENGLHEPVLGVTFDGTGYGTDGAAWGGEFLAGDYRGFHRAAHFRYVPLPGGDRAVREPWRMAAAHLRDAGVDCPPLRARVPPEDWRIVARLLERGWNSPWTSSAGRLFDAVAALLGVRDRAGYEGQAAIELEWLAADVPPDVAYPFEILDAGRPTDGLREPLVIDTRPLIADIVREAADGRAPARIARRFHTTVVEVIAAVCGRLRRATGLNAVVLSGGTFMNVLLTEDTAARLGAEGFRVHRHTRVPPNDGGLSLGQIAVAAHAGVPDSAGPFPPALPLPGPTPPPAR